METKMSAMDYWFPIVHQDSDDPKLFDRMFATLSSSLPPILSVIGERACSSQCAHCIFQEEQSSRPFSQDGVLTTAIRTIVRQMEAEPAVVHEGRMFQLWHLEWLAAAREERPDALVGMIDSGTFLRYSRQIEQSGFMFDWLDISIDGPEFVHDQQRQMGAFKIALNGLTDGRRFVRAGGRISSLFTLTNLNYASIQATAEILPSEVDEWHITTLSPSRPELRCLSVTGGEFKEAWRQIVLANEVRPLFFRIYVAEDVLKLARAVGRKKFLSALDHAEASTCALSLVIDGVPVWYYPQSLAPNETFVLDADAYYRVPYSIAYTLEELRRGFSRFGEDLSDYTIAKVDTDSDFVELYHKDVRTWKRNLGRIALEKEKAVFRAIRDREGRR